MSQEMLNQMTEKEVSLICALHFLAGVQFAKLQDKEPVVKGWNTLSAKDIKRIIRERNKELSR